MGNFFEVLDATFSSGNDHEIKNINFAIPKKGNIVCLLGPSGAGKTTILRTIAGLEKLKYGTISLNGKIISSNTLSISPDKRNIALSFQDNCLFPHKNVYQNILLGLERKNRKNFYILHWIF